MRNSAASSFWVNPRASRASVTIAALKRPFHLAVLSVVVPMVPDLRARLLLRTNAAGRLPRRALLARQRHHLRALGELPVPRDLRTVGADHEDARVEEAAFRRLVPDPHVHRLVHAWKLELLLLDEAQHRLRGDVAR